MAKQVVQPKIRGFICTNAHPTGCAQNVRNQIDYVQQTIVPQKTGLNVLIIGASTGYGLASRIALAAGYGMNTVGVFFEKPPDNWRTATAGYYNTVAFHQYAEREGLKAFSINGDAFSEEIKSQTIDLIQKELGQVDLVIYSLAAPRRIHPYTGVDHRAVLKPIGCPYVDKTIDLVEEQIVEVVIDPAIEQEITDTVAVMGGEDLTFWVDQLLENRCLKTGIQLVAYSYIGPEITYPVYTHGTIGRAKEDLKQKVDQVDQKLWQQIGGHAYVAVNKAVITQASAAIPVIPLYISILYKIMDAKGINENPIAQITRLLSDHIGLEQQPTLDDQRLIRLDDRELRLEISQEVERIWLEITTDNLPCLADYNRYKRGFRNLFGFEIDGVDYGQLVETELLLP